MSLIWSLLFLMTSPVFADESCTDVALFDFKNSVISVKDDKALASAPSDQDALPFKNGSCELKDDPQSEKPDWRYDMMADFLMRPTRQMKLRVIRIYENNLSGSGSWDRVMAFDCKGGALEKLWQHRFTQGVKIQRMNEIQFKVSSSNSKVKVKNPDFGIYQWDNIHRTFSRRR